MDHMVVKKLKTSHANISAAVAVVSCDEEKLQNMDRLHAPTVPVHSVDEFKLLLALVLERG